MTVDWKNAIVRVAHDASSIQHAIMDRTNHGWLLLDQCTSDEAGKVDLVFRVAQPMRAR